MDAQPLIDQELKGKIWHTTNRNRFESIIKDGAILRNPGIPDKERWKSSQGPSRYPYVRHIGGISLFDFRNFEPKTYSQNHPNSSWEVFIPFTNKWKHAIWIEINLAAIENNFISANNLVEKWKRENQLQHTIMPRIEAAYIGDIPISSLNRAFLVEENKADITEIKF